MAGKRQSRRSATRSDVETRGLIGMIEAADAMVKTANVVFVGWQEKWTRGWSPPSCAVTSDPSRRQPMPEPPQRAEWAIGGRPRHPSTGRRSRENLSHSVTAFR